MHVKSECVNFREDVETRVDRLANYIKFNTKKSLISRENVLDMLLDEYRNSDVPVRITYHRGNGLSSDDSGRPGGKDVQVMRRIISKRLKENNFRQISAKTGGYNIVFAVPRE